MNMSPMSVAGMRARMLEELGAGTQVLTCSIHPFHWARARPCIPSLPHTLSCSVTALPARSPPEPMNMAGVARVTEAVAGLGLLELLRLRLFLLEQVGYG